MVTPCPYRIPCVLRQELSVLPDAPQAPAIASRSCSTRPCVRLYLDARSERVVIDGCCGGSTLTKRQCPAFHALAQRRVAPRRAREGGVADDSKGDGGEGKDGAQSIANHFVFGGLGRVKSLSLRTLRDCLRQISRATSPRSLCTAGRYRAPASPLWRRRYFAPVFRNARRL